MTRRQLFLLSFALPALASPAAEFWNEKKPEEWTEQEVKELLTKSPWAKPGDVHMFGGAGGGLLNRNGAMNRSGTMTGTRPQRPGTMPNAPGDTPDLTYSAIVRWQSALPIREALKEKPSPVFADNYIIAVVGTMAMADPDADINEQESRIEMMRQSTKLDHKGGAIELANIEPRKDLGTLFYFSREEPIKEKDGQVTFATKLGPLEVKAKFTVKEMMYRGKLEL